MQITHVSLADIIGLIVVIAFLFTTVLTVLSLFGFGQPPRYYVTLEDKYKKVLFRSLIVELVVICLGVASSNFYNVKEANKKLDVVEEKLTKTETKNAILGSTLIREYLFPGGVVSPPDQQHVEAIKQWKTSNGLADIPIAELLESQNYEQERSALVQDLAITAKKEYQITDIPEAKIASVVEGFRESGLTNISRLEQPDGLWKIMASIPKDPERSFPK